MSEVQMRETVPISTEGRVFVAQLTRDLAAREVAGAHALSPGAREWTEAFKNFGHSLVKIGGPIKAANAFKAARDRLRAVQKQGSCVVNSFSQRSRSASFEVFTWEVDTHPLTNAGYEGIVVKSYTCMLQRTGRVAIGYGEKLAYMSWHALGRMKERSKGADIFDDANGIVAGCGIAGLLMRRSRKHIETEINYAVENTICTGILRNRVDDIGLRQGFFDVLTVLPFDEAPEARRKQSAAIAWAVHNYVKSDSADPRGYADKIVVLQSRQQDYVSRELRRAGSVK